MMKWNGPSVMVSRRWKWNNVLYCAMFASLLITTRIRSCAASTDDENLIEFLFERQNYNPLIRPVENMHDKVKVRFEMSLIQLITLDEKNQVMKTNIWLRLFWTDYQLKWNREQYGGIEVLRMQSDKVWKPDIVLFNNADGRFEVSFKANVLIYENGDVMWIPCSIYKSSCAIDVEYFPFDEQQCQMIYGSWTYNGDEVDLDPYTRDFLKIDLTDYEKSGSWDVFDVPGEITTVFDEKQGFNVSKAVYTVHMRRKTLFYTINLIIPCVLISCLSTVVFYLPASAGEKITMAISILLALVVFLQVLVTNLLPPSSINLPLFAKYLLFTILMDVCSITNAVIVMNWNFKTPRTHRMPRWVRVLFIEQLPRLLFMRRPVQDRSNAVLPLATPDIGRRTRPDELDLSELHSASCPYGRMSLRERQRVLQGTDPRVTPEMNKAIEAVRFISAHLKNEDDFEEVIDDWRYVSLVMDRVLFLMFMVVTAITTCTILIHSPIFDTFTQQQFISENKQERLCREMWNHYNATCDEWYPKVCLDGDGHLLGGLPGYLPGTCADWMKSLERKTV